MSIKVSECLDKCHDKIDELIKKKKELERQLAEQKRALDDAIEAEQQKAADAVSAVSVRMIDALQTKRACDARRKHVTQRAKRGARKKKGSRKSRIPYTRTQLREALECLVEGHKGVHPTLSAAKAAQSVRRAARLFMDGKHITLGRILKKHNFVEKIATMSR